MVTVAMVMMVMVVTVMSMMMMMTLVRLQSAVHVVDGGTGRRAGAAHTQIGGGAVDTRHRSHVTHCH